MSYELVEILNNFGFETICFTMASYEVANLASQELGMKECFGTKCVIKNNFYTGELETELHLTHGKEVLAKKLFSDCDFSVGFGDSKTDIGYLDLLNVPFVVNPDKDLKKFAEECKWNILDLKSITSTSLKSLIRENLDYLEHESK